MSDSPRPFSPRPFSVTVAPLVLSVIALANLAIIIAMTLTGYLPDPVAVLGLRVPLGVLIGGGAVVVIASFAGWYAGRRRLRLSRLVNIAVPALIGIVMPSVWWQEGAASTNHLTIAIAAVVLPVLIVTWIWWRARNTLGAYDSTGVAPAPHLREVAQSPVARSVAAVTTGLSKAAAEQVAASIVDSLRFHSAYLPDDTVYQFRLPNGALLTATDGLNHGRRSLAITMQLALRTGHVLRGMIVRPKSISPEGAWFTGADPKADRRAAASLVNNVQQAFATQDDVVLEGAVVIDPALPSTRIG